LAALVTIQLQGGARQASLGPVKDRRHHLQIPRQFGEGGGRRLGFALPLRFQEQLRLFENPLAQGVGGVAPSGVQLPGFAAGEAMPGDCLRHAPAVLRVGARYRHQILHRDVGRDGAVPHLLLHAGRQQLDQGQPARYPTQAAVKAAGQLLQAIAETLLQFRQQPAFLQGGRALHHAQRLREHQCLSFAERPDHSLHRVPPQLLQGRDALVAINHQVTIRLLRQRHDHDRRLLSCSHQRGQQVPLPLRSSGPQVLAASRQLVKFQSHRPAPCCCSV